MKPSTQSFVLATVLCAALVGGAYAAELVSGRATNAAPTCVEGAPCELSTDLSGNLRSAAGTLAPGASTAALQSAGNQILQNVYDARIQAGTPLSPATATATQALLQGCVYNVTIPTFTDTQQGAAQCGSRGSQNVTIFGQDNTNTPIISSSNSDAVAQTQVGLTVKSFQYNFPGGTNFERQFTCPNTTAINVTAGNTTELVALTASQIIRVCSYAVSISLTGSFKFVSGTGANCASTPVDITSAMAISTAAPFGQSAGNSSLMRAPSANALCLTAATGNVTGYVSWTKF